MSYSYHPDDIRKAEYPRPTIFAVIFCVLALLEIIGIATNSIVLQISAKPLLMPTLVIYLFFSFVKTPGKKLIYAALVFATLGDVFLLFEFMQPVFFMIGLGCFLLTHIFYIIFFFSIKSPHPSFYRKEPWWLLLIYAYSFGLLILIYPGLGKLEIPVVVYAIVLTAMMMAGIHVLTKVNRPANKLYVWGAALFVLSDSLLAINKFYHKFPLAGVAIMITYCAAQFLIVQAFILHKPAVKKPEWFE